jgi:CRP/FNR family transcriptional regulator, anaerobic regulatory protein
MRSCHCHDCEHACIHNVPIFKYLTEVEKQQILNTSITKTYLKGEMIFSTLTSSSNLWVVNTGKVKLSKISSEGKEQIIQILHPGEFLGDLSLFSQEPMQSNAFALQKTEICIINGHDIKQAIRQNPDIAIKFLEVYSKRITKAEQMIEQIGIHDIETRIAKTILQEADHLNSTDITLPYSKTDFASMIGTTRETLSRKLSKFQDQGWIKLSGQRHITILDQDSLEELLQ